MTFLFHFNVFTSVLDSNSRLSSSCDLFCVCSKKANFDVPSVLNVTKLTFSKQHSEDDGCRNVAMATAVHQVSSCREKNNRHTVVVFTVCQPASLTLSFSFFIVIS